MTNYLKLLGAALVTISASTLLFGQEGQKKPAMISQTQGVVNKTYALVQTTIYKDSQDPITRPLVSRAMIDTIGPTKQYSKALDVKLETPVPPVTLNTYGVTKIVDQIGQVVASVGSAKIGGQEIAANPKLAIAGRSIQVASKLADLGVKIAEGELSKLFENQQIRVQLLEIIPTDYYEIDTKAGTVDHTIRGFEAYDDYKSLLEEYIVAFADYRKYESAFADMSTKLRSIDPAGTKYPEQWKLVRNYDTAEVQPRLKVKNQLEDLLSGMFPPYRIAIMASPSDPGNTCGAAGQGPWELYIIYYIGAKQTNQIAVKYCVKNPKDFQRLLVKVIKNSVQQINPQRNIQQFIPGGVQLIAESNATFAQTIGFGQVDFNAPRTEVFNWFQSMVTNPAASTIDDFLLPFDLLNMRQTLAQRAAANPTDAELQELSKSMNQFADALILEKQQAALLEQQKEKEEREKQIKQKQQDLEETQKTLEVFKKAGIPPDKIAELENRIKKLQNEIAALKAPAGTTAPTTPTTPGAPTTPSAPRTLTTAEVVAGTTLGLAGIGLDVFMELSKQQPS